MTMNGCDFIFYTPEYQYPDMPHGEMCGDLMPFYHDGKFVFLFLYKYCIYAVETEDLVHYGPCRIVLSNGTPEEQDWHAATGSICEKDGIFYFYYTGFCEGNRTKEGKYEQAILRAASCDLIHWEKDRTFFMPPDEAHYEPPHWRDPHVFWNESLGKYCMLVTTCEKEGAVSRSGCTAVYVSDDILHWQYDRTLCSPRIYPTMECQDCFSMQGRWYLTFSTYEKQWETRYKTADSFDGQWITPAFDDKFDGRDFYAAKTVSDGTHRYLVGWQAIRKGCSDQGRYLWGGNVMVHELISRPDGTLGVKLPDTIRSSFTASLPILPERMQGNWISSQILCGFTPDAFGWMQLVSMPEVCLIHARLSWEEGTRTVGLMFHTSGKRLEKWCQLRLELTHGRIVLERSGKTEQDQYFEEERPIRFQGNSARITLVTSRDVIAAYVYDTALCARSYSAQGGSAGVFVEYGTVYVESFEAFKPE